MDDGYKDFYKKKFDFRKKHLGGPEKGQLEASAVLNIMNRFGKELDYEMINTFSGISIVKKL